MTDRRQEVEAPSREMDSETGLQLPRPRDAVRRFGRALALRCPNCGGGPVLRSWLKMRVRCGRCGLRLERGEHDYFMGSMLFNFIMTGGLLVLSIFALVWLRWPKIPWDALQYGGPIAMIVLPFLLFPWSKLIWLAFDIALRPVTERELEWHRAADTTWSSEHLPRESR